MDAVWTWKLSGHCAKYSFLTEPKGLTMREVERIFQLDPEPPVHQNLNDYIIKAVQSHNLRWFSFFLHHYENRLNGCVRRFLLSNSPSSCAVKPQSANTATMAAISRTSFLGLALDVYGRL